MNYDFEKQLTEGLRIIRAEGITFTKFRNRVSAMLTGDLKKICSEDFWVFLYETYAAGRVSLEETVEQFSAEHFEHFTIEKNGIELKDK